VGWDWSAVPAQIVSGHHWVTIQTAMFLQGSWLHIIGNMIFLWAFAPKIDSRQVGKTSSPPACQGGLATDRHSGVGIEDDLAAFRSSCVSMVVKIEHSRDRSTRQHVE
jgi:hypothetical protein